jgi:hypothetical protein
MPLHPAENRGYRELFLTAQEAQTRLSRLAEHLDDEPRAAVEKAHAALAELLEELKPALARYDLHAELAARGGGARIGMVRAAILDRFLERNQALRFAVDDLEHVTTLLAYLATVSGTRRAKKLTELCQGWERKMRRHVGAVRKAAVELASDPDAAIEPLDPSPVGKAAHATAVAAGTAGEAFDRQAAVVQEKSTAVKEQVSEVQQQASAKRRSLFRRR